MRRLATVVAFALLGLLTAASGGWGVLALTYSGPHSEIVRNSLAAAFAGVALVALTALAFRRWRWRALAAYLVLFAMVVVWWRGIEPSNDRDWHADVAILPYAMIEGDTVTLHSRFTSRHSMATCAAFTAPGISSM